MDQVLRRRSRTETAIQQGLGPVGNHLCRIEIVLAAEPMALGAGSIHAVEGKRPRFELGHVNAAVGTGQLLRIQLLLAPYHGNLHQAPSQFHGQAN